MSTYNIIVTTDMGHLVLYSKNEPKTVPEHISHFVYNKINNKINHATDLDGLHCRFYILKNGLNKTWTYHYQGYIINLEYQLDSFNPKTMRYC